jgi:hypothetical protein
MASYYNESNNKIAIQEFPLESTNTLKQANCMPHNEIKDVIKEYNPIKVTLSQDFTK